MGFAFRAALAFACLLGMVRPLFAAASAEDEALVAVLKSGGQVVLMRHTVTTPGVGDPPGMKVEDCATQRNLTEDGRRHARAIGERLSKLGVSFERVVSSPMCRCLDTAKLVFGRVDEVQAAVSRTASEADIARQVREMRGVASDRRRGNVVLVSHGTTIKYAVGLDTDPGDLVVVTPYGEGRFEIVGRLRLATP